MEQKKRLRIADMIPLSVEIEVDPDDKEKCFTVRALTLTDIIEFLDKYRDQFMALYATGTEDKPDYAPYLMASRPMIGAVIARAAERDDEAEDMSRLPVDVQIVAISTIVRMSVSNPKKLTEALKSVAAHFRRLQETARGLMSSSPTTSPS